MHSAKAIMPITLSKLDCLEHTTISSPPPIVLTRSGNPPIVYISWGSKSVAAPRTSSSPLPRLPASLPPRLPASLLEVAVLHLRSGVLPVTVLTYPYLTSLLSSAPSPCSPQPHSRSIYPTHTSTPLTLIEPRNLELSQHARYSLSRRWPYIIPKHKGPNS